jgi:hypothetical protein
MDIHRSPHFLAVACRVCQAHRESRRKAAACLDPCETPWREQGTVRSLVTGPVHTGRSMGASLPGSVVPGSPSTRGRTVIGFFRDRFHRSFACPLTLRFTFHGSSVSLLILQVHVPQGLAPLTGVHHASQGHPPREVGWSRFMGGWRVVIGSRLSADRVQGGALPASLAA